MLDEITTTDFSKFGNRERHMATELLNAWESQGLPDDFYDNEVQIMMNSDSGNVFLINEDYQVAMMNGDKLESCYTTPYEGHEGFKDELQELDRESLNHEDLEYLIDIGVFEEEEDDRGDLPWDY
jgi:hypothetical protein